MYDFEYQRPKNLDDAVALLKQDDEAQPLAGGMTLIPTLKQRLAMPTQVVDLGGIADLRGVREEGDHVVVGAMTPHAEVAESAIAQARIPALAKLAAGIGDPQVRHRGTIGGSIANNDPAADYPGAIVGLNATVQTTSRRIAADDFFTGMFETALEEGELVTAVHFPVPDAAAYVKFPNPASRYAIVGALVAKTGGAVRVAITGAAPCVFRWQAAESALGNTFSAAALDGITMAADELNSDLHASAEYRAHLVRIMTQRAVAQL